MRVLHRASFGYLLRHPWQLALAVLGIAIGVAVIVAVDLANSSARKAFQLSMETITGAATHQVIGGPRGIDEQLYVELRTAHGVHAIAPVVEGRASAAGRPLTLLGVDLFAERDFRDYTSAAAGSGVVTELLQVPGAVVLAAGLQQALGIATGDSFEVTVDGKARRATLVGTLDSNAGLATDELLVSDIATAQAWLGMAGRLSRIDARLPEPDAVQALEQALPRGVQLLESAGRTRSVTELSAAFAINLTAMSLLALLVGVFLIYNSVSFAVLQRRQLIGILRGLGLTRDQVVRLVLGEALLLGGIGALLGLVAGVVLGQELLALVARSINDLYFRTNVTAVSVAPASLLLGAAAGVGATLAAAVVPAVEAAGYAPRLALQRVSLEERAGRLVPRVALFGLLAAALSVPLLSASGKSLVAGLVALFLLVLGAALCIPWLVRIVSRGLLRLLRPFGPVARLGGSSIGAHLSRTGVAVVALAVAVSATIGVTVMVGSFRLAVTDWLDDTLQSDLYVSVEAGSLARNAVQAARAIDGVTGVSSSRRVWLESRAGRTRLIAIRTTRQSRAGTELVSVSGDDAWERFEAGAAVLVSESYAYRHGIAPGDILSLPTDRGTRGFRVAASYRSYDANPAAVVMHRDSYDRFWNDRAIDGIGLWLAPGTDADAVMDALQKALPDVTLRSRSNAELKSLSLQIFDQTFVITNVLYWLAVGVAVVGILAAMLALQLERAREFATLRAVGMTRWQVGCLVTMQSALLGIFSGLAAIPLGIVMARMLVDVINRRAFGWSMDIAVPPEALWHGVALAAGSAVLAGLYPAWRAANRAPALAMRED